MTGLEQGAGAAGKFLASLKDLPFWIFVALAMATDLMFFVPVIKTQLPREFSPWLLVAVVLFNVLAISRGFSVAVSGINRLRVAAEARRTFYLSPDAGQSFWSVNRQRDDSTTTQIHVPAHIKNLAAGPLGLVGVRLIKPKIPGEVIHEGVMVRAVDRNIYGSAMHSGHKIPAGASLPVTVDLTIRGVPKQSAGEIMNVTLGVTDDEGNEQRMKIRLRGLPPPKPSQTHSSLEAVFAIEDPIEKEIASVLQSELSRYDKYGREKGGLGSVHIVFRGQAMSGVGNDSWDPNSPRNQSIVMDSENAALCSDNVEALLALYARLSNTDERARFAASLLNRLDDKQGYLRVSYFIVCILWKIGRIAEALSKAQAALPEDEMKVFGLSNVLMLLNGLLNYRHPDFTPEVIDRIESFTRQLKTEHTFRISEKVAAIRAYRLLSPFPAKTP